MTSAIMNQMILVLALIFGGAAATQMDAYHFEPIKGQRINNCPF